MDASAERVSTGPATSPRIRILLYLGEAVMTGGLLAIYGGIALLLVGIFRGVSAPESPGYWYRGRRVLRSHRQERPGVSGSEPGLSPDVGSRRMDRDPAMAVGYRWRDHDFWLTHPRFWRTVYTG